jgi:NAD(P)-dependent dehydrogenase (short-subunit alcohol dehydrogenase family)
MTTSLENKVVLITGASSGLGRELAIGLLTHGAKVAGTVRNNEQIATFEALAPGKALGVNMDVTDAPAVQTGVQKVIGRFGHIDVLANNAGAGTVGAVEETSLEEARKIFEVNFFGGLQVTQAVLPYMRAQRSDHILQFSAIGGFLGYPGLGVYSAAKGATGILGEALAEELKPLGIHVTVLTIGIFHTQFAGTSLAYTEKQIEDYAETPAGKFRGFIGGLQDKQPNDPVKGAEAIVKLLQSDNPPIHAALGADAMGGMRKKMVDIETSLKAWEGNAASTAFERK